MAEWSRETPWRQGHVLTDEAVDALGLRDAQAAKAVVVVVSHDCDLAASPDKEPDVEVIVGRLVEKADGNFTHAKTPRILHIEFTTPDGTKVVELGATKKVLVPKSKLSNYKPSQEFQLGSTEESILQRWLAARYRRAAFPDAFEKRLNESGASTRLSKILRPAGKHICAVFFDVDEGKEVERTEPDDTYELAVVLLYPSQPNGEESEEIALKVKGEFESAFKDLFFNESNSWREIELRDCMVLSDEALTYAQSTMLKQWRLEHLSLREDPVDPIMQE